MSSRGRQRVDLMLVSTVWHYCLSLMWLSTRVTSSGGQHIHITQWVGPRHHNCHLCVSNVRNITNVTLTTGSLDTALTGTGYGLKEGGKYLVPCHHVVCDSVWPLENWHLPLQSQKHFNCVIWMHQHILNIFPRYKVQIKYAWTSSLTLNSATMALGNSCNSIRIYHWWLVCDHNL